MNTRVGFAKIGSLAGALLVPLVAHAAAAPDKRLAGADRYIEQVRADWDNVGAAVAVVRGNEVIYARGFGVRELGKSAKVDADTLFQVGSTSKAFTTAALGLLVDEGKVRWDDPVIDYLPGFQLPDPWLTRNLTIRDAVTHRSGIVGTPYFVMGVMDQDTTVRLLRYAPIEAAFRDSYRYSNPMYAVAGQVIEAASGMSWHEFVKRRLLRPLGMTRSGTSPYEFWDARFVTPTFFGSSAVRPSITEARDDNVAMPHGWDESGKIIVLPWQSYDNAAAAGSIVSSVADMAHWLVLHLDEGRFEDKQILRKETVRELHAAQNLHTGPAQFPFEDSPTSYAMAWRKAEYLGTPHLAHSGGIVGFPAYAALLPERRLGVVVLANGPKGVRDQYTFHKAIAFWIFDRLLDAPQRAWNREFLGKMQQVRREAQQEEEKLRQSRPANTPPSLPLEGYAGVYEDRKGHSGPVSVRVENGRLVLRFAGEGAFSADLEPWHHDVFRLHPQSSVADVLGPKFATFTLDAAGQVAAMSAFDATFERQSRDAAPQAASRN